MYQPPIVNFPVFSATWSESTNEMGVSTPAVLAAGGGGAGNTGVGNKISLVAVAGGAKQLQHAIASERETSPETCNCVAAGEFGQLVAAAFGSNVRIYCINPLGFHGLGWIRADFAAKESGINSMAFADRKEHHDDALGSVGGGILLATGGEDGVLRVWEISPDGDMPADGRAPSVELTMVGECKGHTKPITCVRFHQSLTAMLTASKDGSCRLWDWQRGTEMAVLTTTSGLPTTVQPSRVMCRSCCFSPTEPDAIFSVQSGPRGKSYVTRWRYTLARDGSVAGGEGRQGGRLSCTVEPVRVAYVSPHPATTMSVRADGKRLAVGNVEGAVLVYRLPGFAKVMEHPAHDLPVTGLEFATQHVGAVLGGYDLLAGSADYKLTLFKTEGSSAKLAAKQVLAMLWLWITSVVSSVFWLVRTIVYVALTVIPIAGLVGLGLASFYHHEEMMAIVSKAIHGGESDVGFDNVERAPVVV